MIDIRQEAAAFASWPTPERLRALKRVLPRARVEEVLDRSGRNRSACPRLPAWSLVWFVIALGWFCRDGSRQVYRWLPPDRPGGTPGRSTLCEARKRLGIAPLRLLAHKVIRLQGPPRTPGAFDRGLRTMALDGFILDVPDTPANERALGRPGSGRASAAFPQVRALARCETGSHVLWRFVIKPHARGEVTMAHYLPRFLQKDMRLWWDRNVLSYHTVSEVIRTGAQRWARIKSDLIFEPIRVLDDGSYLAKLYRSAADREQGRDGILVRIIEYTIDDPGRPGSGEPHRLWTTLLDDNLDLAVTLIVLYHERWEEELAIDELKTHQRERPVLRSQTPAGVVPEGYGLLLGHSVIRVRMQQAAATMAIEPRRLSFTGTLKLLRCRLPECPASRRGLRRWYRNLLAAVAEGVREVRRNRINPRVIERKMSHGKKKRPEHRDDPQPHKEFRESIVMRR